MSEHDDFDTRLAQQRLEFQAIVPRCLFELTQGQIERAFAQEKERDDGC